MKRSKERVDAEKQNPVEVFDIATSIVTQRARKRLSQAALAERTGLSRIAISNIETGAAADPSFSTLVRLASGLGISVVELITPIGEPKASDVQMSSRTD